MIDQISPVTATVKCFDCNDGATFCHMNCGPAAKKYKVSGVWRTGTPKRTRRRTKVQLVQQSREPAMRELAEELREYTTMKYAGDCKCGKCQLVPRELVERIYHTLNGSAGHAQRSGEPEAKRNDLAQKIFVAIYGDWWGHPQTKAHERAFAAADALLASSSGHAQQAKEPVAYRWRQPGNKHWIYDPTPEWIEDHKHEIELEALFTHADSSTSRQRRYDETSDEYEARVGVSVSPDRSNK